MVQYRYAQKDLPRMEANSGAWLPPEAIKVKHKYSILAQRRGFVIVDCEDEEMLTAYAKRWRELLDMEIIPLRELA